MNISGIRPSIGFYDTNSIKFRQDIGSMSINETEEEPNVDIASTSVSEEDVVATRKSQNFGAYDFAKQYKPDEQFELKGSDSDIKSLDVEKAVNNMQKDSIIHRYQYFVQNKGAQNSESVNDKGIEDFSL